MKSPTSTRGELGGADEGAPGGHVDQTLFGAVETLGKGQGVLADASGAVPLAEAVSEAVGSAADHRHARLDIGEAYKGRAHEGGRRCVCVVLHS